MSDETPAPQAPETPASVTAAVEPPTAFRRGLRWFLAEFLVVVAGVFVAMLLNAWYQDRTDTQSRLQYLTLLSRDLRDSIQSMDEAMKFEELQAADAVLLYRALSAPKLPADTRPLSTAVSHLSQRRTMLLKSTTYDDRVARDVAGGYLDQGNDLLWQLPPDDPRWAMARSNVVWRLRVSRQSAYRLDQRATAARTLLAAVEAERSR